MKNYLYCYVMKGTDMVRTGYTTAKNDKTAEAQLTWYLKDAMHPGTLMFKEMPDDVPIRARVKAK